MSTVASRFNELFIGKSIIELKANRIEDLITYQKEIIDFGRYTYCRLHTPVNIYMCVMICTRFGNMVVYQNASSIQGRVAYTCSPALDYMLGFEEMSLNYNEFNRIFHPTDNVGIWLENIARMIERDNV